jgi:hypothetical protein
MEYYITKSGYVVCVDAKAGRYSMHYPDEDPDGYVESPFKLKSAAELGWKQVSYGELPAWAKEQFEDK